MIFFIAAFCVTSVLGYAPLREPGAGLYNDASFIQDVLERFNRNLDLGASPLMDFGSRMDELSALKDNAFGRQTKDAEFMDQLDYDMLLANAANPSIRDTEYLQHSSLFGHKYPGGSGSPTYKYKGVVKPLPADAKTDTVLPAYCNPPNPCPVGYTTDDGCIETFENTAAFSRAYQASQDCMCDTEHMFDCPAPKESNSELDLTQNDFLINDLQSQVGGGVGEHKSLVAKKFYNKQTHEDSLTRLTQLAQNIAAAENNPEMKLEVNPFLEGEKLPIAAKKGHHAHSPSSPGAQLNA